MLLDWVIFGGNIYNLLLSGSTVGSAYNEPVNLYRGKRILFRIDLIQNNSESLIFS